MRYGIVLILSAGLALSASPQGAALAQDKARVSGLADVNFGLVAGLGDRAISQSLCAYTSSRTERYAITAVGSGSGGSFTLSSGTTQLGYDVLWADVPNLASGSSLSPNVPTSGFVSPVKNHQCNGNPPTSASLTIVLRDAVLRDARAGSYAGTLQVTIAPE